MTSSDWIIIPAIGEVIKFHGSSHHQAVDRVPLVVLLSHRDLLVSHQNQRVVPVSRTENCQGTISIVPGGLLGDSPTKMVGNWKGNDGWFLVHFTFDISVAPWKMTGIWPGIFFFLAGQLIINWRISQLSGYVLS